MQPNQNLSPNGVKIIGDVFRTKLVTKVKPNINSLDVHPQLSNYGHPVDGVLVGVGSVSSECTTSLERVWNLCSELNRVSSGSLAKECMEYHPR
jgi:hypothetical protein